MPDPLPFDVRFPNTKRVVAHRVEWRDGKRVTATVSWPEGNDRVCRWCGTTGFVVVLRRPIHGVEGEFDEELGPCPYCQLGHVHEFPAAHGVEAKPPWPDGFWQGRQPGDLAPLYALDDPPPSPPTAEQLAALKAAMTGAVKEL